MKRKSKRSQRTLLFRQNVNRDNEEWAHFLEGYREWLMEWEMLEYGDDWHTAKWRGQGRKRSNFPLITPSTSGDRR